jgi:hypothetical protein
MHAELTADVKLSRQEQDGAAKTVGPKGQCGYAVQRTLEEIGIITAGRTHIENGRHSRNRIARFVACVREVDGDGTGCGCRWSGAERGHAKKKASERAGPQWTTI